MDRILNKTAVALCLCMAFIFGNLSTGLCQEQVNKVGTSAAAFLRIPVGVRGAALGGAFVAISDDASAMFWNPGGIARIKKISLFVDHSPWLPGVDFNYFGLAIPVQSFGVIALSVTALTSDKFEVTTMAQPNGTGETFSADDFAVGVAYARNLTDRFSIGANFKFVNETIMNSSAVGFMFDIGTLYDTPFPGIRLGVSISNVGTEMQMDGDDLNVRVDGAPQQNGDNQTIVGRYKTDAFDAPVIMRVGLAWNALQTENGSLVISTAGAAPNDNSQSLSFGAEYSLFEELLVLRGGFNDLFLDEREKGLTLGFGINIALPSGPQFSAGYAFQSFQTLGGVNRFSLEIRL